ncbi:MAG TPA: hypothetical protein VKA89_01155 [Solirubrobacterales bacterium]|nr:hypothetical protein [Solirubrobacterales bacterium]
MPLAGAWRAIFLGSAGLAAVAGLMLFAGAAETDRFFSWTIEPPMTAAFLGATYWAVMLLFASAARTTRWPAARVAAWPEALAATLLLVATLVHLDKFHDDLYGYFWVVVYALAAPGLVLMVWLSERLAGRRRGPGGPPVPAPLRVLLGLHAAAFAGFGAALFVAPESTEWPWALTPLTGRALASFLLGFGLAAALAVRQNRLSALRGAAGTYALLGALELLAAAIHSDDFTTDLGLALFAGFFGTVLAAGLWGLAASRRAHTTNT